LGLFSVIPTALLLALSFFVLFTNRKVENEGLKTFGYVIAVLLWIAAALVFSAGIYILATGQHPMAQMMQQMMQSRPAMMQRPTMNR
jgi:hypothetical protein